MKKGISLIILVITIIVIIILVGAVVISLIDNNAIKQASQATFMSNLSQYNNELSLYLSNLYVINNGNIDTNTIFATTPSEIRNIIKGMSYADAEKYIIEQGKLVIKADATSEEITWASQAGIDEQQYYKNDLVLQLDGYDSPQNISNTYYWMDRSIQNNNMIMYNFNDPLNSITSGYDSTSKSYVFDGIDDYMRSLQNIASVRNQYTIEILFKPTVYKYTEISFSAINFKWRMSGQVPYMNLWDTTNNPNSTHFIVIPELNKIHYFATTFDGFNRSLYINGQLKNSVNKTMTLRPTSYFVIGNGELVKGNIYAIRVYNKVLSSQELIYNYSIDVTRFVNIQ